MLFVSVVTDDTNILLRNFLFQQCYDIYFVCQEIDWNAQCHSFWYTQCQKKIVHENGDSSSEMT